MGKKKSNKKGNGGAPPKVNGEKPKPKKTKQGGKNTTKSGPPKNCNICFNTYSSNNNNGNKRSVQIHTCLLNYCTECLEQWVVTQAKGCFTNKAPIVCPDPTCKHEMKDSELEKKMRKKAFKALCDERFRMYLAESDDIIRCPLPTCQGSGYLDSFSCREALTCAICNHTWKDRRQCTLLERFTTKSPLISRAYFEEERTEVWKILKTKCCPKCQVTILKNGGCSHMTCGSCQTSFCWSCGQDYNTHDSKKCSTLCSFWGVFWLFIGIMMFFKVMFGIFLLNTFAQNAGYWFGVAIMIVLQPAFRAFLSVSTWYNLLETQDSSSAWRWFGVSVAGDIGYSVYFYLTTIFWQEVQFFLTVHEVQHFLFYPGMALFIFLTGRDHGVSDRKTVSVFLSILSNVVIQVVYAYYFTGSAMPQAPVEFSNWIPEFISQGGEQRDDL